MATTNASPRPSLLTQFRTLIPLLTLLGTVLLPCCALRHQVPMAQDDFGLNFVPVHINGHPGLFLVDSGASHTIVDHRFARRSMGELTPSHRSLAWLGSQNTDAKEGVVQAIQIGSHYRSGPFRIDVLQLDPINQSPARLGTFRIDGILGADFLTTHEAEIDYRDSSLRFRVAPKGWKEPLKRHPRGSTG